MSKPPATFSARGWYAVGGVLMAMLVVAKLFLPSRSSTIGTRDAGTDAGPRVAIGALTTLQPVPHHRPDARTIVSVVPAGCRCDADLDALATLTMYKPRFARARMVFISPDALGLSERRVRLGFPITDAKTEFEELLDRDRALEVTKPTTFVLDANETVLFQASPLDPDFIERLSAVGDPDRRSGDPDTKQARAKWLQLAWTGHCKHVEPSEPSEGAPRIKAIVEVGASGWLTRADVKTPTPDANRIHWDMLQSLNTYRYELPSAKPEEIFVECYW
jgi:hypothetical protein